jgi:hypothetical protein
VAAGGSWWQLVAAGGSWWQEQGRKEHAQQHTQQRIYLFKTWCVSTFGNLRLRIRLGIKELKGTRSTAHLKKKSVGAPFTF